MSEVDIQQQLDALKAEFEEFKKDAEAHLRLARQLDRHVEDFKNSQSSRRGLPGLPGKDSTVPGPAGKDAVIKVAQVDGKIQVIDIDSGRVQAEIVAIPGPVGATGSKGERGESVTGPQGMPGKSPSLNDIVQGVVKYLASRLS